MKVKFLTTVVFIGISLSLFSQRMSEGINFLSFGVGPRSSYHSVKAKGTPALKISFDHGFKEIGPGYLTLGGALGFFNDHYNGTYTYVDNFVIRSATYKENWMTIMAAFRVGYYYNLKELINMPQLNAYAGMASGIRYSIYSDSYDGPGTFTPNGSSGTKFHMAGYGGLNYFITKKLAVYTEFGYDFSPITAGLTLHL